MHYLFKGGDKMGQIWEEHIHNKLTELDKVILPKYREESKKRIEEQNIDFALYEKEFKKRIKSAIKILTPITNEATSGLVFYREKGVRPLLKPNEKLRLILIHQLFGKSNRNIGKRSESRTTCRKNKKSRTS